MILFNDYIREKFSNYARCDGSTCGMEKTHVE